MENLQPILDKIKQFKRKFYINELIRGVILFIALGFVYFLLTLFIETWLWLNPIKRWILFTVFLSIELFLLYQFIGVPLFKLTGIYKGISKEEGAKFIGKHFPDIDDKLLNIIQLNSNNVQSEMLIASVDQRAKELRAIPFLSAIDFKSNIKYLKYLLPLFFIFSVIFLTNSAALFSNSLNRVVNPSKVFEKPAPFYFRIVNTDLNVFEKSDYILQITTIGDVVPNDVYIVLEGNVFLLKQLEVNLFEYRFRNVVDEINFSIQSNAIVSKEFLLNCLKVPTLESMEVMLKYPLYTKRINEHISNVGQLTVPRGTIITWKVSGQNVEEVNFKIDSLENDISFSRISENTFQFSKTINKSFQYLISSQNNNIKNFEPLNFSVRSVLDEYPRIKVQKYDALDLELKNRFLIDVSDDYLVSDVLLCFFIKNDANTLLKRSILKPKKQFHNFIYSFTDSINFIDGKEYSCYFEVWDNDGISGSKFTKSQLFSFYKKTKNEIIMERLQNEKDVIKELELERLDQQELKKDLDKFKDEINAKRNLNFKDQTNFKNFLEGQKKHEAILNRKKEALLKSISEKTVPKSLEEKKADLEKRLQESLDLNKKNKLLEELKELAKKLNKDDLVKKLNKLSSQNKQKDRSLERLVEMTKRFYVQQKALKIQEELKELSEKLAETSKKDKSQEMQQKLTKEFEELVKELNKLKADNKELKKPMDIPDTDKEEESIKEEMQNALDAQNNKQSPKKHQKRAADEIKEMAMKMQFQMQSGEMEMIEEDMESLRAIVENLVNFSFQQESLLVVMEGLHIGHPSVPENVKKQHQLKTYFEHIDDSLYTLSLRMEKMSSKIDKELNEAHYALGMSIDYFEDVKLREGLKSQQYVMTAVNNLAVMLSDLLESMMNAMPMPGSGKGKGEGISLPDIIKKQSELLEKMEKGMNPGKQGEPNEGESGGEGENGKDGNLYKLFQEQSKIKEMFEQLSKNKGGSKAGEGVSKKMDELLEDIIEHGFTDFNLKKMTQLKYELLKLKKAFKQQGKKEERQSIENISKFKNSAIDSLLLKKYFKTKDELLLRQSLPLQYDYKIKVINYFKTN